MRPSWVVTNPPVHPHTRGEYFSTPVRAEDHHAVHPHTRGEYTVAWVMWVTCDGSPPHAWGILALPWLKFGNQRFTPTRVGNTDAHAREGSA